MPLSFRFAYCSRRHPLSSISHTAARPCLTLTPALMSHSARVPDAVSVTGFLHLLLSSLTIFHLTLACFSCFTSVSFPPFSVCHVLASLFVSFFVVFSVSVSECLFFHFLSFYPCVFLPLTSSCPFFTYLQMHFD